MSSKSFSNSLASMAPGTLDPSANKMVGVPFILCFFPYSKFLSIAELSQERLDGVWPLVIQSCQVLGLSLLHQMFLAFSIESALKMGYKNK